MFLPEGWVNTLMAGAGLKRANRASYTAAGYAFDEQGRELLIERVQAGSAQDLLRDNNRVGYSAGELDGDGLPFSFFEEEEKREKRKAKGSRETKKQLTTTERIIRAVRREHGAVAVCCVLLVLNIILLSFWGQALIDGVRIQDKIDGYQSGIDAYNSEIASARVAIGRATSDERVRNVAQKELGMLRKERVATDKIYIQMASVAQEKPVVAEAEEGTGVLDWLLSVADIFDFKS